MCPGFQEEEEEPPQPESDSETVFTAYTANDLCVISSTVARLQASGLEAKSKSELALRSNVNINLEVSSPGQTGSDLLLLGVGRLDSVLSPNLCDLCLAAIGKGLDEAIAENRPMTIETGFGNVLSRNSRWDMYQRNEGAIALALQYMLGDNCPLSNLFAELFQDTDALLYELSALVSDPGAQSQSIHPDTEYEPVCPLYTIFVALQDVTEDMGGTIFMPGTNTMAHHVAHKARVTKNDFLVSEEYRRSVMKKGDCAIFDSRTLHCGPANTGARRTMLYFTVRNPHYNGPPPPKGSMFKDLHISLSDFLLPVLPVVVKPLLAAVPPLMAVVQPLIAVVQPLVASVVQPLVAVVQPLVAVNIL
jgi:hypothetical protein